MEEYGSRMRNKKKERRIVVAVDESEESMYALSWCLTNLLSDQQSSTTSSTKTTTTVVLLYVKPPPPAYISSLDLFAAGDVVATLEKYSTDLVNSVMNRAEDVYRGFNTTTTIKVEKKIGSGDAKNVICVAVEKLGADVLVMGSHDYGFFKRALLGSVSDYCSKHVKCPLVVVKRPKNIA